MKSDDHGEETATELSTGTPSIRHRQKPIEDAPPAPSPSGGGTKPSGGRRLDYRFLGRPSHDNCHAEGKPSPLSHRQKTMDLRGLFNLLVIIVVVQNARLVLENFIKYGVRITLLPPTSVHDLVQNWPILLSIILMHGIFFGAFVLERWVNPWLLGKHSDGYSVLSASLCILNAFMVLSIPYYTVKYWEPETVSATLLLCFSITWFLKLASFHLVLADVRYALAHHESLEGVLGAEKALQYPLSLSFQEFYVFLGMPTFDYPRSPNIQWFSVLRHAVEMVGCLILMKILIEQYMVIIVQNTFIPMPRLMKMSVVSIFAHLSERILKLSIPNLFVWLLMFVSLFHHWLNILGELTRFADREFYGDWWNSASIEEYWRKWNIPIHHFMTRHIHKPLLRRGIPRPLAGQVVFILSALAHEYLVCAPLHIGFTGLVFSGFMAQVPLMHLTSTQFFKDHPTLGNVTFWVLFCFTGQPLAIIVYSYLWGVRQGELVAAPWGIVH